ncbi:MAG: hypothetical protein WBP64_01915 [Nitrososphaeraceae archaeon]
MNDIHEREVPQITDWMLKGCDLNKDVEMDEKAQLYLPDIQLKFADQVFRMYVKALHGRAVCRGEKSLTLNLPLVEAIDSITLPMMAINELKGDVRELNRKFDPAVSKKCVLRTDLQLDNMRFYERIIISIYYYITKMR